jgi:hypothetical protein
MQSTKMMRALLAGVLSLATTHAGFADIQGVPFQLRWQSIASGSVLSAANPCYRLSGTLGQPVVTPGMATADTYSLFTGFWSAAPISGQDQLFFSSFEDCAP